MAKRCRETDKYIGHRAESERPGHIFRIDENREIVFMEDEIMERIIGRKLDHSKEYVIHRNGNPLDNRRENLGLMRRISITASSC